MAKAAKRVAIIGAGSSGITAIKCCLDEGLEPVCFERTGDIGGLWNFTPEVREDQACVMKGTVINTSKEMMCYSDFVIPAEFANFMHNTKVMQYFKMYVKNFNLDNYIRFNTAVLKAREADDFVASGQWVLETQSVSPNGLRTGTITTEIFDAVLACTGHHASKRTTNFPGQETFTGKMVHTHDYKDHHGYEGKNVIVVGIGNSGGDATMELSRIANQVYLSTRTGSWVFNRVGCNGMPWDINLNRRIAELMKSLRGENHANDVSEKELNERFDHVLYGLEPKHRFLNAHPTVIDELPNRVICGSVIIKPDIKCIRGNEVEFLDGTVVKDVDAIITAVGYIFGFPYIDEKVIKVEDNVVELFKYVFPPEQAHPTLAVIGCIQPWGAIMPIAELQCRWATRVFKGNTKLPSKEDMWKDIQNKRNYMKNRYVNRSRHTIQVDWIPFLDQIADQFGAKPDLKKLFLTDPKLALTCYFGPCTPYQYRLHGPNPWEGAREAIMTVWDRVHKPLKTRQADARLKPTSNMKYFIFIIVLAVVVKFLFF